jgi:hypothetical protein
MPREYVKFKLLEMPCCGQLLCWVNPRMPNYCPECGKSVWMSVQYKDKVIFTDDEAYLVLKNYTGDNHERD